MYFSQLQLSEEIARGNAHILARELRLKLGANETFYAQLFPSHRILRVFCYCSSAEIVDGCVYGYFALERVLLLARVHLRVFEGCAPPELVRGSGVLVCD